MTDEQFKIQIDRLMQAFGQKPFDPQRLYMIKNCTRNISYNSFGLMIDNFIATRRPNDPPLPKDFRNAAVTVEWKDGKRDYALGELQPQEIAECWDCADSGFIRIIRKEKFDEWAKWWRGSAPCHCVRGRMLIAAAQKKGTELGPQFGDNWKSSYVVDPEYSASPSAAHYYGFQKPKNLTLTR